MPVLPLPWPHFPRAGTSDLKTLLPPQVLSLAATVRSWPLSMMWMASLLVELLSSQSLWILSMPNTEAPHEELSLVVEKWKQEGTFHCTCLSTEASLKAFPPPQSLF